MAQHEAQKAEKLTVEDVARQQLDGEFLKEFEDLLDFFKREKISLPWKSINGFKMTCKGKTIGGFTLGAGGWLDDAIETKNYLVIHIASAERGDEENYLNDQTGELAALFIEQIGNKCEHCRPTCGCSKAFGRTIDLSGERREHVCMNALGYKFIASGGDLKTMTMCTSRALYPPEAVREVPVELVEKVILARKGYVEKMK